MRLQISFILLFTALSSFVFSQENLKPSDVVTNMFTSIEHDQMQIARKGIKTITRKKFSHTRVGYIHEETEKFYFDEKGYMTKRTLDSVYNIEYEYNKVKDLVYEQGFYMKRDSITMLLQEYTNYIYNDDGRLVKTQRKTATGGFGGTFVDIEYNDEGMPEKAVEKTTEYILNKSFTDMTVWNMGFDYDGRIEDREAEYYDIIASRSKKRSKIDTTFVRSTEEKFSYDSYGNLLVRKEREHVLKDKFFSSKVDTIINDRAEMRLYENNKLVNTEIFAVEDGKPKISNKEEYFYDDKGLIYKTIFYDTYSSLLQGGVKYTPWFKIEYDYEFY